MNQKVSACIISKNEANLIQKCIESISSYVDEVIVLDTGSIDNTVEIAKKSGAKVYCHDWNDNFSEAKNICINYSNHDWIFILDADEIITHQGNLIKKIIQNNQVCAYTITRNEVKSKNKLKLIRLFKKSPNIYYQGIIHEQLHYTLKKYCEKTKEIILDTNIEIDHFGYLPEIVEKKDTINRNIKLLEIAIEKESKIDFICYYKIKLAYDYFKVGKKILAEKLFFETYHFLKEKKHDINLKTFVPLVQLTENYVNLLNQEKKYIFAKEVLDFCLKNYKNSLKILYLKANNDFQHQKYLSAIKKYKKALSLYNEGKHSKSTINNEKLIKFEIPYMLGINYERLKMNQLAIKYYEAANKFYKDSPMIINALNRLK